MVFAQVPNNDTICPELGCSGTHGGSCSWLKLVFGKREKSELDHNKEKCMCICTFDNEPAINSSLGAFPLQGDGLKKSPTDQPRCVWERV